METSPFGIPPPKPSKQHRGRQSCYKNNSKQKSWNFNWNNKHNGKYVNENNLFKGDLKEIPTLIPREKLPYAHKLVKILLVSGQLPNVQIAGRLRYFVEKW